MAVFAALVLLWTVGQFDLALIWRLAALPENEYLFRIGQTLLEGHLPGAADLMLPVFVGGGLLYGLGGVVRSKGFAAEWRRKGGHLAVVGAVTIAVVAVLKLLFARSDPVTVLSGVAAFTPWFQAAGPGGVEALWEGSFPAAGPAMVAAGWAFALARGWRSGRRLWMGLISPVGGALLVGLITVYGQWHWPSDVAGGCLVGLLVAWLLRRWSGEPTDAAAAQRG